jgi:hypothetical protein
MIDFLDGLSLWLADFLSCLPSRRENFHEIPLDEMIKQSKLVATGKVVRIEEMPILRNVKKSVFDEKAIVTIEIEQIIVGSYKDKHIDVTYYPRLTFEAWFVVNQRCIFFIGENNQIVKGYGGKIPIENGKVEVRNILGEATSQTLKDFTERIKDSKSRQETILDKPSSE